MHTAEKHLLECEFCAEVVTGLDQKGLAMIRNISSNVNQKVTAITGYKPTGTFPGGTMPYIFSVVVLITLLGTYTVIKLNSNTPGSPVSVNNIIVTTTDDDNNNNDPYRLNKNNTIVKEITGENSETLQESDNNVIADTDNNNNINKSPVSGQRDRADITDNRTIAGKTGEDNAEYAEPKDITETDNIFNNTKGDGNKDFDQSGMDNRTRNLISVTVEVIDKQSIMTTGGSSGNNNNNGQVGSRRSGGQVKGNFRIDEMPEYVGGDGQLKAYMKKEIKNILGKYEKIEKGSTAYVSFIVTSKGKIEDVELGKGVPEEIQDDVTEAIIDMPRWKPAKKKGKIRCVLSITFD